MRLLFAVFIISAFFIQYIAIKSKSTTTKDEINPTLTPVNSDRKLETKPRLVVGIDCCRSIEV